MRSPAEMEVIQIEITNACPHSCSNCTRFCGHHKHPFFMDWPTFKCAVDSLQGYDGIVGMMGGEPTLHPEFERMTIYLYQQQGMLCDLRADRRPVKDFLNYTRAKHNANRVLNKCKGPGLWSSMPVQYYKYYELIQDSFVFQCLNDHYNSSFHQPLLIARKDLGIPDEKWIPMREACWIQNCWSASITPKGAFFCEVAAALDMLFDGPGGWPVESGWWHRKPADFVDQLHWCEMCGAPMETTRRDANDQIDDISPSMSERLQLISSPKMKKGSVNIYQPSNLASNTVWSQFQNNQYIADFSQRLSTANLNLLPKAINGIIFSNANKDGGGAEKTIQIAMQELDNLALIVEANSNDQKTFSMIEKKYDQLRVFNLQHLGFGQVLNIVIGSFSNNDWVLLLTPEQRLPVGWLSDVRQIFINPGVFYTFELQNKPQQHFHEREQAALSSAFYLFNQNAFALRQSGQDGVVQCKDLTQFKNLWPADKQICVTTPPWQMPKTDEHEWKHVVDRHILNDDDFCSQFALIISHWVPPKANILITQSASYFLTRALTNLLIKLGYSVYLLTHERFAMRFEDVLPPYKIFTFNNSEMIKFDLLMGTCESIKASVPLSGAVVPYSTPRKTVEPEDGYQDIEKLAHYIAGHIICRVNLKRQFVTGHADHRTVHDNRWGY